MDKPKVVSMAAQRSPTFQDKCLDMAKSYRDVFDAFISVGFNEKQAIELLLGLYVGELVDADE